MKRILFTVLFCIGVLFLVQILRSTRPSPYPPRAEILIFSPHPDDAALCCAGVIQQAIGNHKTVLIVDVTNGDDFASAAGKLVNKSLSSLTSADMIRFAGIRQKEELDALNILGMPRENILFLAYPDGMLDEVYAATTARFHALPHTYTTYKALVTDYHSKLYHVFAPYTKLSVTADITDIIQKSLPSEIYVTSDKDTAMDHVITNKLVVEATRSIGYQGKLFTYIIHGTDNQNNPTTIVSLTPREMTKKHEALAIYKTQFLMNDFPLFSFAKNTEIFW